MWCVLILGSDLLQRNVFFFFLDKRSYFSDQKQEAGTYPTTKARIIIRLHKQSNGGLRVYMQGVGYTIFIE